MASLQKQLQDAISLGQKDKAPAFVALIPQILSSGTAVAPGLHSLVDTVVNQDSVGLVVGRQVLSEITKVLSEKAIADDELRKEVIQDIINVVQPRIVSYEEQVNALRLHLADILEAEEDWSEAAKVLMSISMDSSQRSITDAVKLDTYIRIVRLLLEEGDSVQAETYYNRAALLIHSNQDKEIALKYKLCQARISDYNRKFLEAASRYHELSYVGEIDEEERRYMLSAAVTCAVLAPAGPNRSRVLASLYRDERTVDLVEYNILSKMFLDHILRPAEVKSFEANLKPHQLAKIAAEPRSKHDADEKDPESGTRTGPATVLDRAVMEHNVLASSKIYNNITFRGLGALLDLTPSAAETMARKMIEQGRLRGSIDQVDKLIWFETSREEDDAQGKAGGLGDDVQEAEDTGGHFTKRWDAQIRISAANVESIVEHLVEKGLVKVVDSSMRVRFSLQGRKHNW
ncbi:hypothetical protein DL96DRAFT_1813555 [Flagelloscypha sp. PMI_526]|nr:hypothetical protein DL96DRAFT_1813555 [Flagelloscypha sp. PMI_526]